jgi:hypothetical protein
MAQAARAVIEYYSKEAEKYLVPYISGLFSEVIGKIPYGVIEESMAPIGTGDSAILYGVSRFGLMYLHVDDGSGAEKREKVKTEKFVRDVMYRSLSGSLKNFPDFGALESLVGDIERLAKNYDVELTGKRGLSNLSKELKNKKVALIMPDGKSIEIDQKTLEELEKSAEAHSDVRH